MKCSECGEDIKGTKAYTNGNIMHPFCSQRKRKKRINEAKFWEQWIRITQ